MFNIRLKSYIWPTGILSTVGAVGFLLGRSFEKSKNETPRCLPYRIRNVPALPLFSTVSAAEPAFRERSAVQMQNFPLPESGDKLNRTSQIMKYGFPGLDNVRSFQDFVLSYDQRNRIAHWVFEHLRADKLTRNKHIDRQKCDFKEDPSIHTFFRRAKKLNNVGKKRSMDASSTCLICPYKLICMVSCDFTFLQGVLELLKVAGLMLFLKDYKRSGYDRGHLAAAGNHRISQEHVDETFYLTNIAPQVGPGFNRDAWNDLEKYVRKLARTHNNVYVCTGPLFLPMKESNGKTYVKYEVIGSNHVAVPTHFFKVIVMENDENNLEMESYVMPNKAIEAGSPLHVFQVPPESIERASGLLFFNRLSRSRLKRINNKVL